MAPRTERMKVEVTDSTEGETRTFNIILRAPNGDFQLADLLRQRGVMSPIDSELKQAVRVATKNYLAGAEALISTLEKASTAGPKTTNSRNRRNRNPTRISPTLGTATELQRESTAGRN